MGVSGRKGVDNNEPANPTEDNPLTTHSTTPATTATVKNLTDKIKTEKQAAGEFKSLLKEGMSSYTRIMKCPMPFCAKSAWKAFECFTCNIRFEGNFEYLTFLKLQEVL